MTLKAIDAFAGAGGLSLGLEKAGFSVALAFDNDQVAVDTHRKNLAGRAEVVDAAAADGKTLLQLAGIERGQLDLLAGGPPCQGFSLQRRGARDDPRNLLVLRYLNWLDEMRPRAFLMENVAAIRSVRGKHLVEAVEAAARGLGFEVHAAILDAAEFGVPQRRRRAFLVGLPKGVPFSWPTPVDFVRTVGEAIRDLPSPPEDGTCHPQFANHYREARLSALNVERIKHVPPGGGREYLPKHLQLACHQGNHRHLDTYGRLSWDEPSVTITARFDSFTRGRFGHPEEHRSITLREGARLQSFPDSFAFLGNREDGARLIGNAVPPLLANAIGNSISASLSGRQAPGKNTPQMPRQMSLWAPDMAS
ncbi:DNA cytosine methyltransferase [Streptomyces sp. NPDC002889]|uniref:DNA cytosine methyltransferase n=1 Tax=Streptomyces sp. NPDC002889 TaxID=3364669 RepID=UPI0036A6D947